MDTDIQVCTQCRVMEPHNTQPDLYICCTLDPHKSMVWGTVLVVVGWVMVMVLVMMALVLVILVMVVIAVARGMVMVRVTVAVRLTLLKSIWMCNMSYRENTYIPGHVSTHFSFPGGSGSQSDPQVTLSHTFGQT